MGYAVLDGGTDGGDVELGGDFGDDLGEGGDDVEMFVGVEMVGVQAVVEEEADLSGEFDVGGVTPGAGGSGGESEVEKRGRE